MGASDPTHACAVYGPVAEIKLHKKGGYGFVKYELHDSAVKAIVGSHGRPLHGRVRQEYWTQHLAAAEGLRDGRRVSDTLL